MYYNRQVSQDLLAVLAPGGPAHSLVVRHLGAGSRVDLQLRGYPDKTECRAALYCGLTKAIELRENNGRFRLDVHATWAAHGLDVPWRNRMDVAELTEVWPQVDAFLDAVIPVIGATRWYGKEGVVQNAVSRLTHAGIMVFDREAVPGFDSDAVRLQVMWEVRDVLLSGISGREPWWVPPKIGEECDATALDAGGRLLAIEVKPARATAASITWAPLQAAYYAGLFGRWADEAVDPSASITGMVRQRQQLGLTPPGPVTASEPLAVVPMVIIGGGLPTKEVTRRCLLVRDRILASGVVDKLDVMVLDDAGGLSPLTGHPKMSDPPPTVKRIMTDHTYRDAERLHAVAWKQATKALPEAARAPGPYRKADGHLYPFCLPWEYAEFNLLPEVRNRGRELFTELGIPWHAGVEGGPGNHLLSSQMQCVNALTQMVDHPARIQAAFGGVLDIADIVEIEDGRMLTFEFIGEKDYFGESRDGHRTRGANCTSVDAAFTYRTSAGVRELALVEWKYTEDYTRRRPEQAKSDLVRAERYETDYRDGPLRSDLIPFADMLDEPFYQLMRQQLLAARLEAAPEVDATVVRVVHVLPPANIAYQLSLTRESHRSLGNTVGEVWPQLLREPDRFVKLDPEGFLDPAVTSEDYVQRYAPDTVWDEAQLLMHFDATDGDGVSGAIDFEGYVTLYDDQVELNISRVGTSLEYPFRISELYDLADEIEEDESIAGEEGE